jgi:hypothetical protein
METPLDTVARGWAQLQQENRFLCRARNHDGFNKGRAFCARALGR